MDLFVLLVCLITLGICAYTFHKVRLLHIASYKIENFDTLIVDKIFSQLQAYDGLMRRLQFLKPLPPLRQWAASPDFLLSVAEHTLKVTPLTIVECSSGSSTVVLARCCELNGCGHVFSLEHDPVYAAKTRDHLSSQGLQDFATVIDAPLVPSDACNGQLWYSIEGICELDLPIDLLVIDGPPWNTARLARYPALPVLWDRLAVGCSIFLDDADRVDEVEAVKRWGSQYRNLQTKTTIAEKGCALLEKV